MTQRAPDEQLLLAALDVINCLSDSNYRTLRQPSRISDPIIGRQAIIDLVDAVEGVRPGVIERMFEIRREARR